MTWIKTIDYQDADKALKKVYDRVKGPDNNVDNVLLLHSLRPHSLVGHMALYKNVLHNSNNTIPKWYLEALGVYVSHLNQCAYCVEHHLSGLRRLQNDNDLTDLFVAAMRAEKLETHFDSKHIEGMLYAKKLTLNATFMSKEDVTKLQEVGFTDGEVLEINQVVSYFNYVNRSVLGLGVNTEGDIIGLSPNDSNDPDDWSHQ